MTSYPTFKRGDCVFASRIGMGADAFWRFDEPVQILHRYDPKSSPYRDQPAYKVRFPDGGKLILAAESLSAEQAEYPGLTWLEVLDARGISRPAGF
jgi:hypothetical protein